MNINKKNAGRRIKKIRVIDLDMNQKQFAKKLGITQPMVSKYEKGQIIPPAQILLTIAKLGKTTVYAKKEVGSRKTFIFNHPRARKPIGVFNETTATGLLF